MPGRRYADNVSLRHLGLYSLSLTCISARALPAVWRLLQLPISLARPVCGKMTFGCEGSADCSSLRLIDKVYQSGSTWRRRIRLGIRLGCRLRGVARPRLRPNPRIKRRREPQARCRCRAVSEVIPFDCSGNEIDGEPFRRPASHFLDLATYQAQRLPNHAQKAETACLRHGDNEL